MTHYMYVVIANLLKYQRKKARVKKSITYCYSPCHFIGDEHIDVVESKLSDSYWNGRLLMKIPTLERLLP